MPACRFPRSSTAPEHVIFDLTRGMFASGEMTSILLITAGIYMLAGLLFFWRAKRRLRQNVF